MMDRNHINPGIGSLAFVVAAAVLACSLVFAKAGRHLSGFDAVYPPTASALVFSHKAHADKDCRDCHVDIAESGKSADRNLPSEKVCAACHAEEIRKSVYERGDLKRCGKCHTDFDPFNKSRPSRVHWPTARIKYSHKVHVNRMIACHTCHKGIEEAEKTGGRHLPKETICLGCHEKTDKNGDGVACTYCHTELPSGAIKSDFDGEKLVPTTGRLNHHRQWMKRHNAVARISPQLCKNCHQQRDCNKCHDGVMKPMKIHPEDYAAMHPIDARKSRNRCTACHRYQSFCVTCHTKLGVGPKARLNNDRVHFHPTGFGSCRRGPNHHAGQAKRSLTACVSCHAEGDCLKCHRSGSACGGRFNIHGHLNDAQLSRMKKRNPKACRKCHGNM